MSKKVIGIISDTHGLLRNEVIRALNGVDVIIHAGDIGNQDILEELSKITRVVSVRGNADKGEWAEKFPQTQYMQYDGLKFYIIHNIKEIDIDLKTTDINIVIYGHSHKSSEKRKNGMIYINPGSAGPKRFNLPISLAILKKDEMEVEVEFIYLPNE